jgi:hypothetical protein
MLLGLGALIAALMAGLAISFSISGNDDDSPDVSL